jgi:AbrB family looped-hinge helix DNA binding protein
MQPRAAFGRDPRQESRLARHPQTCSPGSVERAGRIRGRGRAQRENSGGTKLRTRALPHKTGAARTDSTPLLTVASERSGNRCPSWAPRQAASRTGHGRFGTCLTLGQVRRYLTCMKTTVSSKGQIVLPAELRQMDRIEPGQEFDVERLDRGDYRLVRRAVPRNEGATDWLLSCPQKDFFVPIDSESTDAL